MQQLARHIGIHFHSPAALTSFLSNMLYVLKQHKCSGFCNVFNHFLCLALQNTFMRVFIVVIQVSTWFKYLPSGHFCQYRFMHPLPNLWRLVWLMSRLNVLVCLQPHQGLGLLLIFVVVELIPSQNEPAAVPSLHKASLLPEPATPDDTWASLPPDICAGLTSTALGTAVGQTLVLHNNDSNLQKKWQNG